MGKGPIINGKVIEELGNYYKCSFVENDVIYNSVEQYYQASKCVLKEDYEKIIISEPKKCARIGRKVQLVENWEYIKYDIMKRAVFLKFEQNENLKQILLNTQDYKLYYCENIIQDQWDIYNEKIHTELRTFYCK